MHLRRRALTAAAAIVLVAAGCTTRITVRLEEGVWTVACRNVSADDCDGIVRMYFNNLARNYTWVRDESGARILVDASPTCPDFGTLAQPGACWRVMAPVSSARACMIMARRITPEQGYRFVWIGGDQLAGSVAAPRPGTTRC